VSQRRSFLSTVVKVGAAAARQHAAAQRRQAAATTRALRERARDVRRQVALDRLDQRVHQEREVDALNADLVEQIDDLATLLSAGLGAAEPLDFASLKHEPETGPLNPGKLAIAEPAPALDRYLPAPLDGLQGLMPWARRAHAQATELAMGRFGDDVQKHREREAGRKKALAEAQATHERKLEESGHETDEWNVAVDDFAREYGEAQPSAIADYCRLVLENSDYPGGFPKALRIVYAPESRQLVIQYDCPTIDVVPEIAAYKYVKSKNQITTTQRPVAQRRSIYASVVAQITLRTLHELFIADTGNYVDSVVFNGHVNAIDKGTGQQVYPCLVTVRTTRDLIAKLNLANVDPQACLRTLNASVSPSPSELVPVRPVLEFNMVDPRFVEEADVLSTLDTRPNLMELSPTEFESLITNLFEKMGLETRQTQASRDGGVDCVAYDPRPIFGGKVVIQAKRYKNTVGVSAVRDLFGTLQNEGASKGILVTTSGYGKAAFDFANGKPLELLAGSHLLFLLEQHAGVKAKIEVPDTWRDPVPDTA
jgi:restriction system protein